MVSLKVHHSCHTQIEIDMCFKTHAANLIIIIKPNKGMGEDRVVKSDMPSAEAYPAKGFVDRTGSG